MALIKKTVVLLFLLTTSTVSWAGPETKTGTSPKSPYAYLYPKTLKGISAHLQREEIDVHEILEDIELDVEVSYITDVECDEDTEGEKTFVLKTEGRQTTKRFPAGTVLVKVKQKGEGALQQLLSPHFPKSTKTMRRLKYPKKESDFPVVVLKNDVPVEHGLIRSLKENREFDKPITFSSLYDKKKKVNFSGSPINGLRWLEGGEFYLQVRDGRLYKVHAVSGRSEMFFDPNELAEGLVKLPTIDEKKAKSIAGRRSFKMNPARTAFLLDYQNDLYYSTFDGKHAVRLTSN